MSGVSVRSTRKRQSTNGNEQGVRWSFLILASESVVGGRPEGPREVAG
jgi:hypothetical protein